MVARPHWEAIGKCDEWDTPSYVIQAFGDTFDMDVAHPANRPTSVPCKNWISELSLLKPWRGFIWCNPPFGQRNGLDPWLTRFIDHGNGIALTPDRTSAPWFQRHAPHADLLLFVRKKIQFTRPDGTVGKQPNCGTCLWAKGERGVRALVHARDCGLGMLVTPS
ncbi:adenine methyltransferase [Phyllobacterium sp. BT25]|uniref:Adenine methyltransferase n=1 Tax=Phyllobacterium pellucidum TaxID=2740464 RepID=A0A849VNW7_9HYPH|nr:DNA N-6-adenine-methyltransferase [Phyllobacterium pellucidum]NTS29810.1 adenine methyltransferase [Phyllobacterium pellucidum]